MHARDRTFYDRFPNRAVVWRLRTRLLELPCRPLIMGIVNVTPDSFSDGGEFLDPAKAVDRALLLAADGADLIDIGGESTRPYAEPVPAEIELQRVAPVVAAIAERCPVPASIDTSKAVVAREAIQAGAEIINDVTGFEGDPDMMQLAVESHAGVCAMHMRGTPANMQDNPQYENVVDEVETYLESRRDALVAAGVTRDRICLDPGIGFGKTHLHNLTLMSHAGDLHALGCPVLVGHSRKGFLGKLLDDKGADRTNATVGAALALAAQGVQIIRCHDVRPVQEAMLAFDACGGARDSEQAIISPSDVDRSR